MNLSDGERSELMAMQRSRRRAAGEVRRARLVLLLDEGLSLEAIKRVLGCDSRVIGTWGSRFASDRLASLHGRHPGRVARRDLARLEARVPDYTLKRKPADGSTHWSNRKLAKRLKVPRMTRRGSGASTIFVRIGWIPIWGPKIPTSRPRQRM
ncbi:hypothetical protein [Solimonas flava]|uniref:hypothetical protein n=1 Tax=Solimonas flava TaxID=415849 RepID=UPI001B7FE385|nr:hypothetical protein [Solimonas flava]